MKLKNSSIITRWILTYAIVLLIPIFLGIVIQRNMEEVVLNQYEIGITNLQIQTQKELDGYLSQMKTLCRQLSHENELTAFIHLSSPVPLSERYRLVHIQKTLVTYQTMLGVNNQFYIYFNNISQGLTTDSLYDQSQLFQTMHGQMDLTYSDWLDLLSQRHFYTLKAYKNTNGNGYCVVMLFTLPGLSVESPQATLVQLYNDQTFSSMLKGVSFEDSSAIMLIDEENHIIASNTTDTYENLPFEQLTGSSGQKLMLLNGEKQWILYNDSSIPGWRYVSVVPSNAIDSITAKTRASSYMMVLFGVLVGFWLLCLLSRRNYRPVKQLLNSLKLNAHTQKGKNEFERIYGAVINIEEDRKRLEALWNSQQDHLQQDFFDALFFGDVVDSDATRNVINSFGIRFISDYFYVCALYDPLHIDASAQALRETVLALCPACVVNLTVRQNTARLLLNIPEEASSQLAVQICEKMTDCQDGVHFVISSLCIGLSEIADCYREINERLNCIMLQQRGPAEPASALPGIMPDEQQSELLPQRHREQMIYYLRCGNAKMAAALFRQLCYHSLVETRPLPTCTAHFFFYEVAAAALAAQGVNADEAAGMTEKTNHLLGKIEAAETLDAMYDATEELLVCVGNRLLARKPSANQDALEERIVACVKEHYKETDFNASSVSEYLSMNMSYLSKYFKAHTGIGLYDYINRVRINEAKRIIAISTLPVSRIAQDVGFENINTFIRVFKKYENVTPGTYRTAFQGRPDAEE